MIDIDLALIAETPGCIAVLRAYQAAQETLDAQLVDERSTPTHGASSEASATDDENADTDAEGSDSDDQPRQRRGARWLPRLLQVEQLASAELSKIHGRLIAFGLLKCELGERSAGVQYQLTHAAKQVLNHVAGSETRAVA